MLQRISDKESEIFKIFSPPFNELKIALCHLHVNVNLAFLFRCDRCVSFLKNWQSNKSHNLSILLVIRISLWNLEVTNQISNYTCVVGIWVTWSTSRTVGMMDLIPLLLRLFLSCQEEVKVKVPNMESLLLFLQQLISWTFLDSCKWKWDSPSREQNSLFPFQVYDWFISCKGQLSPVIKYSSHVRPAKGVSAPN